MKIKEWIKNGFRIVKTSNKEQVVDQIKRLLSEADLSVEELDSVVTSIDGRLWEEELKRRIQEEQGSKLWTMQEIEELYESELDALQSKIDQLEEDKRFLESSNLGLTAKMEALTGAVKGVKEKQYSKGLLRPCNERELYAGEIEEILLDTLTDSLAEAKPNSRRYDVLKSLLDSNPYDGKLKEKRSSVKALLKDASGATERVTTQLRELGLTKESEGKHVKYSYYGNPRYMVTLAKTSSDHRAGMNVANTIIEMML